jgi:hypothetical protein
VHKKKLVVDEPKAVFEKGAGVVNYKSIRLVAKAPGQKPSKPFTFKEVDI